MRRRRRPDHSTQVTNGPDGCQEDPKNRESNRDCGKQPTRISCSTGHRDAKPAQARKSRMSRKSRGKGKGEGKGKKAASTKSAGQPAGKTTNPSAMASRELKALESLAAKTEYTPELVKLPTFNLLRRENNEWLTLPAGVDAAQYLRRVYEMRKKRKRPVLLVHETGPEENLWAAGRQQAARTWLQSNDSRHFLVEDSLRTWPHIANRLLKGPGLLSEAEAQGVQQALTDETLANFHTNFGTAVSLPEIRMRIVSYLGHGDKTNLQATCKFMMHAMSTDPHVYFDLIQGSTLEGKTLESLQSCRSVSREVVVGTFSYARRLTYEQRFQNHVAMYRSLSLPTAAPVERLVLQNVMFLNVNVVRSLCNSLPTLQHLTIVNCQQFPFTELEGLLNVLASCPFRDAAGNDTFRHLEFGPMYYEGPRSSGRQGSFGAFWNRLQGDLSKTICSFVKEWYFPGKAVGFDLLEIGSAFRAWLDRLPFRADYTMVAMHEILKDVELMNVSPDTAWETKYLAERERIITLATLSLAKVETNSDKQQEANMLSDKLFELRNRFRDAKLQAVQCNRLKFADAYFAVMTEGLEDPLKINRKVVPYLIKQNAEGKTSAAMLEPNIWQKTKQCKTCDIGAGAEWYARRSSPLRGKVTWRDELEKSVLTVGTETRFYNKAYFVIPEPLLDLNHALDYAIHTVAKLETDFSYPDDICAMCVADEHIHGADANHHNLDLKAEVLDAWTAGGKNSWASIANLVESTGCLYEAQGMARYLDEKYETERTNSFSPEAQTLFPQHETSYRRIQRYVFPHGPVCRELGEVQYPDIGMLSTSRYNEGYLPTGFAQSMRLHLLRDESIFINLFGDPGQGHEIEFDVTRRLARMRQSMLAVLNSPDHRAEVVDMFQKNLKEEDFITLCKARARFNYARLEPNQLDGDWDAIRRREMDFEDMSEEERASRIRWSADTTVDRRLDPIPQASHVEHCFAWPLANPPRSALNIHNAW